MRTPFLGVKTILRLFAARGVLAVALLTLGAAVGAQEPAAEEEDRGLVVVGVVGPSRVVLTAEHPRATKPVVVFVENRNAEPEIIAEAARLQQLVALQIQPLGGAAAQPPVLVPPPKFPLTLRPHQKLALVFLVTFERGEASSPASHFRYTAAVPGSAPASSATAGTFAPSGSARARPITRGADKGATVTASPTRVVLKKGTAISDPITFTAKWNQHPFFVSGWEEAPGNDHADADLGKARTTTARAQWDHSGGGAGQYTVGVFLEHSTGNMNVEAHPTVLIDVISVTLKDDQGHDPDGLNIGVSTGKDRSRTLTATVTPAAQTSNVKLKISKGGSNLSIKGAPQYGNGTITFKVEGVGKSGSAALKDCTIEASVDGKPAVTADVTVVVPKLLSQSRGAAYTTNLQANSSTTPAQPATVGQPLGGVGPNRVTPTTFYGFPVTVTVKDHFGRPITDANNSHLYFDAPVFEAFIVSGAATTAVPINLKIRSTSDYVDPVGFQVWHNSFFGGAAPQALEKANFPAGPPFLFTIPNFGPHPAPAPTVFQVVVDGFPVLPKISRTLDISGTTVTLVQSP